MPHLILFLCVANSARSQMAEGLARTLVRDGVSVMSAGSTPSKIHPLAAAALAEAGIESVQQFSKGLDQIPIDGVNTVITLCEEEVCPILPEGAVHMHWPMPDPAVHGEDSSQAEAAFRDVRDRIKGRLQGWLVEQGLAASA